MTIVYTKASYRLVEVARLTSISVYTLREFCRTGFADYVPNGRRRLMTPAQIDGLLAKLQAQRPVAPPDPPMDMAPPVDTHEEFFGKALARSKRVA